jgi:1,4-alpha-glucan branching enzyme
MAWLEADDADGGTIAYVRFGRDSDPPVIVVANFTPEVREGYRIGAPMAGFWREVLCSDAEVYGGSGIGNKGGLHTEAIGFKGQPCSLVVTAPPLGCSVFVYEG